MSKELNGKNKCIHVPFETVALLLELGTYILCLCTFCSVHPKPNSNLNLNFVFLIFLVSTQSSRLLCDICMHVYHCALFLIIPQYHLVPLSPSCWSTPYPPTYILLSSLFPPCSALILPSLSSPVCIYSYAYMYKFKLRSALRVRLGICLS